MYKINDPTIYIYVDEKDVPEAKAALSDSEAFILRFVKLGEPIKYEQITVRYWDWDYKTKRFVLYGLDKNELGIIKTIFEARNIDYKITFNLSRDIDYKIFNLSRNRR